MIYKNVNGTQKLVTNIRKPKKWKRFEYLIFDGQQYIDLGLKGNLLTNVNIKITPQSTSNMSIFGATSGGDNNNCVGIARSGANMYMFAQFANKAGSVKQNITLVANTFYNIKLNRNSYIVNDVIARTFSDTNSFTTINNLLIGKVINWNDKSNYIGYIHECIIEEGGQILRHMVPAQYNGQYGMWDLVEDKFYRNQGTGTFTVGSEIYNYDEVEKIVIPGNSEYPKGLELCDYLQGDGAAYIDSGYSLNRNCSIDITLQLTEKVNQTRFVGLQKSGCYLLMYAGDSGNNIKTYTKIASGGTYSTLIAHNTKINTYYINNSSHKSLVNETSKVTHTDIPATDDYYGNCYLFWANRAAAGTQTTARIYSCRIYDNEVLVRDFIPCIYNNEPGMWDKVNRIFYGNSGSGNFIAQSNTNYQEQLQDSVPSNVTLYEYIQGDGINYIDTGIVLTKDSTIEFTAQLSDKTNQQRLIGVSDTNLRFFVYIGDSGANIKTYTNFNATNTYATLSVFNKAKHKYVLNEYNTHKCYLDEELVHTYTGIPDTDTNTKTCYIFWANGDGNPKSACRIYECKIYTNNTLVGHFVPCKYNGQAGLWDIVTQTFYGNSSANFSLGPEMTLQKEIPIWVQKNALTNSTIGAYINTGVFFDSAKNYIFETKFKTSTASKRYIVLGSYDGTPQINFEIYNDNKLRLWANSEVDKSIVVSANQEHTLRIEYIAEGTWNVTLDDISKTFTKVVSGTNSKNFRMFCDHRSSSWTTFNNPITYYYMYIYENGEMIRKFVPATMGGRPGLYDKVNHKMYFNANSSGAFTVE